MKIGLLIMLGSVCAAPALAYDSMAEVTKECARFEAGLLKAYLAEHPQAKDCKEADERLLICLMTSSQHDEALKLLEKKYTALLAMKQRADSFELIRGCLVPMFYMYLEAGYKEQAKAFMERAEKDWADVKSAEHILKIISQFKVRLKTPYVGDTMELKFKAVDGREVDLAALKGKVVLVEYWASWCKANLTEWPSRKDAYAKYHDKGFEIIGISLDSEKAKFDEFMKTNTPPWLISYSGAGWKDPLAEKYGINGIPATFLVGRDGKLIACRQAGPIKLEAKLAELFGK